MTSSEAVQKRLDIHKILEGVDGVVRLLSCCRVEGNEDFVGEGQFWDLSQPNLHLLAVEYSSGKKIDEAGLDVQESLEAVRRLCQIVL